MDLSRELLSSEKWAESVQAALRDALFAVPGTLELRLTLTLTRTLTLRLALTRTRTLTSTLALTLRLTLLPCQA